jgi:hypothetical protein
MVLLSPAVHETLIREQGRSTGNRSGVAPVSDNKSDGGRPPAPHEPAYSLAKAAEMLKQADLATNEEDRQAFRALAEQWQRLAEVAKRPHI